MKPLGVFGNSPENFVGTLASDEPDIPWQVARDPFCEQMPYSIQMFRKGHVIIRCSTTRAHSRRAGDARYATERAIGVECSAMVGLGLHRQHHINKRETVDTRAGPASPPHQKCRGVFPNSGTTQLGIAIAKISNTSPTLRISLARIKRLGLSAFMQSNK